MNINILIPVNPKNIVIFSKERKFNHLFKYVMVSYYENVSFMVKIAVSLTVANFYENPKNGQCSGNCGLKMASGERVKLTGTAEAKR